MAQAKKALINSPDTVVCEAIEGLVSANPHLARLDGFPAVSTPCCANAPQLVGTGHSKSSSSSEVDGQLTVRPLVAAPATAVGAQPGCPLLDVLCPAERRSKLSWTPLMTSHRWPSFQASAQSSRIAADGARVLDSLCCTQHRHRMLPVAAKTPAKPCIEPLHLLCRRRLWA
jgi:hypothetical protein